MRFEIVDTEAAYRRLLAADSAEEREAIFAFGDQVSEGMNLPKLGLPPLAGYAVGYRMVRAYTQRTGKSVVDSSFVSASEIIAESRFFA